MCKLGGLAPAFVGHGVYTWTLIQLSLKPVWPSENFKEVLQLPNLQPGDDLKEQEEEEEEEEESPSSFSVVLVQLFVSGRNARKRSFFFFLFFFFFFLKRRIEKNNKRNILLLFSKSPYENSGNCLITSRTTDLLSIESGEKLKKKKIYARQNKKRFE